MTTLANKHIVLGLTGGIACYKAAALCRELIRAGASVQVVMTQAAHEFITATTMQALSGRPVAASLWESNESNAMPHINLSRHADAIVVAPATAHFIAKLAHGFADDLLSTLCVGRTCPLLIAPAMNVEMWSSASTQRNLRTIREDGALLLGPAEGDQACGETGMGRLLEPDRLLAALIAHWQPKSLVGKRVLITAGPTYEPIDPVRGLTNKSSGRMGYAIARAAAEAGARVVLVSGPTALPAPADVLRIDVETALDMHAAVMNEVATTDVFIAVAAVADWRATEPSATKRKKHDGAPTLALTPNPDILADVAALARAPFCVGFAAESDDLERHAIAKRAAKKVPLLVANLGPSTFGRDDNELLLVDAQGATRWPRASKLDLARRLIADIAQRLAQV